MEASESSVDETTTGFAAFAVLLGSLYVFKARQVSAKRAPPPKPKINDGKRWFQRNRKVGDLCFSERQRQRDRERASERERAFYRNERSMF